MVHLSGDIQHTELQSVGGHIFPFSTALSHSEKKLTFTAFKTARKQTFVNQDKTFAVTTKPI